MNEKIADVRSKLSDNTLINLDKLFREGDENERRVIHEYMLDHAASAFDVTRQHLAQAHKDTIAAVLFELPRVASIELSLFYGVEADMLSLSAALALRYPVWIAYSGETKFIGGKGRNAGHAEMYIGKTLREIKTVLWDRNHCEKYYRVRFYRVVIEEFDFDDLKFLISNLQSEILRTVSDRVDDRYGEGMEATDECGRSNVPADTDDDVGPGRFDLADLFEISNGVVTVSTGGRGGIGPEGVIEVIKEYGLCLETFYTSELPPRDREDEFKEAVEELYDASETKRIPSTEQGRERGLKRAYDDLFEKLHEMIERVEKEWTKDFDLFP